MASRLELQTQLEEILGSRNVYYQPPESIKLKYPCIIYELSSIKKTSANNHSYINNRAYQITLIDEDPESEFVDPILELETCRFDSAFATDGLNHYVFTLFY